MQIGIIGFQKSGKTTVFNALTGHEAAVSAFATGKVEPNIAVVPVPDTRLDRLSQLFQPKKTTPATVRYVDLAGIAQSKDAPGDGMGESQLNAISPSDALMAVIRGFENAAGEAPEPRSEAEAVMLELALSDLKKVETRLERLIKSKGKVNAEEAKRNAIEQGVLERAKQALESGAPIRTIEISPDGMKTIRGFQFLTLKPLLLVVNSSDGALGAGEDPAAPLKEFEALPHTSATWIAGQAEMEISRLDAEERTEFLASYNIEEPASSRIIRLCYDLLGLMSFLTVGPDECRAWTVEKGATAPDAAGAIHSDLQRGFIRAEVCRWDDLLEAGSLAELKKRGKYRLEGKTYIVEDGDIVNVLFSV